MPIRHSAGSAFGRVRSLRRAAIPAMLLGAVASMAACDTELTAREDPSMTPPTETGRPDCAGSPDPAACTRYLTALDTGVDAMLRGRLGQGDPVDLVLAYVRREAPDAIATLALDDPQMRAEIGTRLRRGINTPATP